MILESTSKSKMTCQQILLWAIALIMMILTSPAGAQETPISIAARADKDTITIGDRLTYSLTVTHTSQTTVQPPDPGTDLSPFEISDYLAIPRENLEDGRLRDQFRWQMTTFNTGELEIPPVGIVYLDSAGTTDTLTSPPVAMVVKSLLTDQAADIRDIKPPASMPRGWAWLYWAATAAILLAAAIIYFHHLRKKLLRRDLDTIEYRGPPRPAHEIALEELDRIAVLNLLGRGLIKQFYAEISETIKRYIARRYGIQTMELTTSELLARMRRGELPEEHILSYQPFFEECDLVKFAKHIPIQERTDKALAAVRQLVLSTREEPLVVAEPAAEITASAQSEVS